MEQNKKPRVTILMPVYNGETYLSETIDSVLKQTFVDFYFLIINDGSTDNTEKIIKSYDDKRIIYHKNEQNLGLVATLNKGLAMIETEFTARVDADDLWESTKLTKQISLLDARPDVGICGTSIVKFGTRESTMIFPIESEYLKVGFLFYCMMSHPSVVFRMSFLNEAGLRYKSDFYPAEDYKMWVDALDLTHIYNIPEPLVRYRQHEEQITQVGNTKQQLKTAEVRLEVLRKIYPNVLSKELKFHELFISLHFKNLVEYNQSKRWIEKLCAENEKSRYVNSVVLKKELYRYLRAGYKSYVLSQYFQQKNLKSAWKYLLSGAWIRLSPKQNIGLLISCFK